MKNGQRFVSCLLIIFIFSACEKEIKMIDENFPFKDKSIVCFGASNVERGYYIELLPEIIGGTYYNVGIGGTCICQRKGLDALSKAWDKFSMYNLVKYICDNDFSNLTSAVEYVLKEDGHDYRCQAKLLQSIDFSKIDIILISYGGNEFSNNISIGDNDSKDVTTYLGGMNYSLQTLISRFPHLKILVYTTYYRWLSEDGVKDTDNTKNGIGLYTIDYANAMVNNAMRWHIPVINMVNECGFNQYNHHLYFLDGSHFNKEGGRVYANRLAAWMRSVYKF